MSKHYRSIWWQPPTYAGEGGGLRGCLPEPGAFKLRPEEGVRIGQGKEWAFQTVEESWRPEVSRALCFFGNSRSCPWLGYREVRSLVHSGWKEGLRTFFLVIVQCDHIKPIILGKGKHSLKGYKTTYTNTSVHLFLEQSPVPAQTAQEMVWPHRLEVTVRVVPVTVSPSPLSAVPTKEGEALLASCYPFPEGAYPWGMCTAQSPGPPPPDSATTLLECSQYTDSSRDFSGTCPSVGAVLRTQHHLEREFGEGNISEMACPFHTALCSLSPLGLARNDILERQIAIPAPLLHTLPQAAGHG